MSEALRARLIERFNEFVAYEKSQDFERQFDLHPPKEPLYADDVPDKDVYARIKRELADRDGRLVELVVKRVGRKVDKVGRVPISISTKLQKGAKVYKDDPIPAMTAHLVNGEWYFTLTYVYI